MLFLLLFKIVHFLLLFVVFCCFLLHFVTFHSFFVTFFSLFPSFLLSSLSPFPFYSPQPNCFTRNVVENGTKKILIVARDQIAEGEELTYDYKMSRGEGPRVPCYCGAARCTGFMN